MTIEELKAREPKLYAEVIAAGVAQERVRLEKGLGLMDRPQIAAREGLKGRIVKGLREGEAYADTLEAVSSLLTADLESPPDFSTGDGATASGEQAVPERKASGKTEPTTEV